MATNVTDIQHIPESADDIDISETLETYNKVQALRYFPVFVFLVIIMAVGVIGNIFVLLVYGKRFRKTSSNYFIVTMALFDLSACLIGLPTELYDLRHSYTFYSSSVCKIFRYMESVVVYGSAIILIEIAFDRYFKICRPLMMIEIHKIKIMCIIAGIVSVIIATPAAVLFGISRTQTPDGKFQGFDCSIEETYKKKIFQKIYYYILGFFLIVTVTILSALYIRIWIEIKRRKSQIIGDHICCNQTEALQMTNVGKQERALKRFRSRYGFHFSDESTQELPRRQSFRSRLPSVTEAMTRIRISRTTVILFSVTIAFIVSYLPAVTIMTCRSVIKNLEDKQTLAEQILSKLFSKFYFLNNAINPIIYSFLNLSFRRGCVSVIKQVFLCRRSNVQRQFIHGKTDSQRSYKKSSSKSNRSTKHEDV